KGEIENPSELINDGIVHVKILKGTPPFIYKWSHQPTSLESSNSSGLTEGVPVSVLVTDSNGATATQSFIVKPESLPEHFNGTFTPMVNALGAVLFYDPFSAIGIYDPIVYADGKEVPVPGWTTNIEDKFILNQWLIKDGAQLKEGDPIAI